MRLVPTKHGFKVHGTNIRIRKRHDSRYWQVCVYFPKLRKYKVYSTGTENEEEAITYGMEKQVELKTMVKHDIEVFPVKFDRIIKEWVVRTDGRVLGGHQSKSVFEVMKSIAKNYMTPFLKDKPITKLNGELLEEYAQFIIENGAVSARSFEHHNMTLSSILKFAREKGWYKGYNIPKIEAPPYKIEDGDARTNFTDQEVNVLVRSIDEFIAAQRTAVKQYDCKCMKAMIHFINATGCRTNDFINLTWADFVLEWTENSQWNSKSELRNIFVDLAAMSDDDEISQYVFNNFVGDQFFKVRLVGKGKIHHRTVPVDQAAIPYLVWWWKQSLHNKPTDLVFSNKAGKYLRAHAVYFKKLLEFAKIPYQTERGVRVPYSLRHTFITKKLVEGKSPFDIGVQCGTSVKHIQETYCHMLPAELFEKIFKVKPPSVNK